MALTIRNREVERLAEEVAQLAQKTKTEAVRRALVERRARLRQRAQPPRKRNLLEYLERKVWPLVPPSELGRRLTKPEEDRILGYGPEGF